MTARLDDRRRRQFGALLLLLVGLLLCGGCTDECRAICEKLVACQALADRPPCQHECRAWFQKTPKVAKQTWQRVQPRLASPCRTFFEAALR